MLDFSNIQGIIFDLDGTLYEDTAHFQYYAQRLAARLSRDVRDLYRRDVDSVWEGKHTLKLGRVYDRTQDLVLETTAGGRVLQAWDWKGKPLSAGQVQKIYPRPLEFDLTKIISIGDGWWIPAACAYHYGLEETYSAYLETRDYLSSGKAVLTPIPGLVSWLEGLKGEISLIVATNSNLEDANHILKSLGLEEIMDKIYPEAEKPRYAQEVFLKAAREAGISEQRILSIGDNFLNDIFPAQQLGMKTCLLDPHGLYREDAADLVLKSLRELFQTPD
ncbi:MAG: HAD family hydrolase [Firmicutes bacterium]|nr:HAD family hydrolase [Bacillota bacterium]